MKLEAAEELAKSVEEMQKDYYIPMTILIALAVYRQSPAMPSLERILEAMETLNKVALGAEWVKVAQSSEALDTLSELRKALGK